MRACGSRWRAAFGERVLFKADLDTGYLYVDVNVVGAAFSVLLKYYKTLLEPR